MLHDYEIPAGSRLYFGRAAKLKRAIEGVSSRILSAEGYEEIITPLFPYHQHQSLSESKLIRFGDHENETVSLRADSTLDVVRLVTKRLGKNSIHTKWYYIQPVFHYPSLEQYQIGAESMADEDLGRCIRTSLEIFDAIGIRPLLHLSHIQIPRLISEHLGVPLDVFEKGNLEQILGAGKPWLTRLALLHRPGDLAAVIAIAPEYLKAPLAQMQALIQELGSAEAVLAPLYFSKMRYYDALFYRFIDANSTMALGGCYETQGIRASGFALYSDPIIEKLLQKEENES